MRMNEIINNHPIVLKKRTMGSCPQAPPPQKCTHLLYCSVLSLGGNVNTRWMSKPEMGSIFHIKNRWKILVIGNYFVNYQNFQNLMLLTSSDTKRPLMHLFLFTNSAQRELVSICTQSIHDRNKISLPYILDTNEVPSVKHVSYGRAGRVSCISLLFLTPCLKSIKLNQIFPTFLNQFYTK